MGACNDCWRLRRRCRAGRADSLGSEGDTDARQIQAVARRACILYRGLCTSVSASQRTAPVWCARFEGLHDSYRIRFCCRYDGLNRLDSGGGSHCGCTQGGPGRCGGKPSNGANRFINPWLRRRNCRNPQRKFVACMVCRGTGHDRS